MKLNYISIFLLLTLIQFAQEVNIVPYLKAVEDGNKQTAVEALSNLKQTNPEDPSVIFLDAVLTQEGESALKKYETVYNNHPQSNYADASLYRMFSYYYSLGVYQRAESLLGKLKNEYPNSPYLKAADRSIPDERDLEQGETLPVISTDIETSKKEYNFTIQAGAFLNADNANSLLEKIKADGYPTEMSTKSVGGSLLNVVTFGRLTAENEARPLLEYLKTNYNLTGRVISINN